MPPSGVSGSVEVSGEGKAEGRSPWREAKLLVLPEVVRGMDGPLVLRLERGAAGWREASSG